MTDTDLEDMKVFCWWLFLTVWTLQEIFRSMDSDGNGTINIKASLVVMILDIKIKCYFLPN